MELHLFMWEAGINNNKYFIIFYAPEINQWSETPQPQHLK